MKRELYRYTFPPYVTAHDIEGTLLLAVWGAESLHGEAQVRLDAGHFLDVKRRSCVICASTIVGRDINRLFAGFMRREFGEGAFKVDHADVRHPHHEKRPTARPPSARHSF